MPNSFKNDIRIPWHKLLPCELYEVEKIYDQFDVILINDRKLAARSEKLVFYQSYSTVNTMKPQTEYRITQICGAYWFYHQLTRNVSRRIWI